MHCRFNIVLLFFLIAGTVVAQEPLNHKKKIYQSPEGKLYVNKDAPLYLWIAHSPDEGADKQRLRSKSSSQYANPMYLDTEGYNTIRSPWKIDPETKKYIYPREDVIFEIYADSKPPTTSLNFGTEDMTVEGHKIFLGEKVQIKFESKDELSGVEQVYYSINGEAFKKFSQPIPLNEEKELTIKYYATDYVGNAEQPKEHSIVVDLTNPHTGYDVEGDKHQNVISARSQIRLKAKDDITEVTNIYYSIDGNEDKIYRHPLKGEALSEGDHTLTYYSIDKVQNKEEEKKFSFFVDKTPPRVVEELIGNSFIANGKEYFSGRNKLKLISMDNKAGVKEVMYSINNSTFKTYSQPFYLSQGGSLNIETLAIDHVNNKRRSQKLTNRSNVTHVDISGPDLNYHFKGPSFESKDTTFITEDTKIYLSGKDNESGFKYIEYNVNTQDTAKSYEKPFSLNKEGIHTIQYTGYDNLSNTNSDEFLCLVDTTGPQIFFRFSMLSDKQKTINEEKYKVFPNHVVLFLSATDTHVGYSKMYYSINGSPNQLYSSLIEGFRKNTKYDLKVTAVDKLGNEKEEEIHFYIE